jgi:hypothetical protein
MIPISAKSERLFRLGVDHAVMSIWPTMNNGEDGGGLMTAGITSGEFPKEKMGRPTIAGGSEEIVG